MLKRLRRPLMALWIAGVVTASALGAGIGSSGTAYAQACHTHIHLVPVYTGTGSTTLVVRERHCPPAGAAAGFSLYFYIGTISY